MKKPYPFASVLARVRREQGFVNAHSFYKARDGRRTFGLSFANYMALERGLSLPKAWRLEVILKALDLTDAAPQWKELVRSYLTCLLGSDALLRALEPAHAAAVVLTSDEVGRQALSQRAAQLELGQWRVLAADSTAYFCHVYLVNTPGWSDTGEIAEALALPAAKVKSALKALSKAKIIELTDDRARSPFVYKFLQTLPLLPATTHLKSTLLKNREAFATGRGQLTQRRNVTTRMTRAGLDRYFQKLAETVTLSGVYGDAEKSEDSDVYFIDARIFKIFD